MKQPIHTVPDSQCIPGFWEIPETNIELKSGKIEKNILLTVAGTIENLLDVESCDSLISLFNSSGIESSVSVSGLMTQETYGKGSIRTTGWSTQIADQLSHLIIPHLPIKICDDYTPTDWWQNDGKRIWKPHSISPMLRFMRYGKDSEHYAHYDAGYYYDSTFRTLKSLVIYLTTNKIGATRFINDNQNNILEKERNHDDWTRRVKDEEVIIGSYPIKGKVLLFDHRLCHDVEQYDGGEETGRIIIRGDVIYEAVED